MLKELRNYALIVLFLAFAAITADNIIAGIMAYSYGVASHQG